MPAYRPRACRETASRRRTTGRRPSLRHPRQAYGLAGELCSAPEGAVCSSAVGWRSDMVGSMDGSAPDPIVDVAFYAAAGELQREAAEVGLQQISEPDLRRALRSALQFQLGPRVNPEYLVPRTAGWTGRLGRFDIAITSNVRLVAAVEVKWCKQADKLLEALWDALKLAAFTGDDDVAAYLVYGAPTSVWTAPGHRPAELFNAGNHNVAELLSRYKDGWQWLLTGNRTSRPVELRSGLTTPPHRKRPSP